MRYLVFFVLLITTCSSCYRMPEEGEVSTVPNTNNPILNPNSPTTWNPPAEY